MPESMVVIIGTLDTKGDELKLLQAQIQQFGCKTMILDLSTGGDPAFSPDISAAQVACAAEGNLLQIQQSRDTAWGSLMMIKGAIRILTDLLKEERLGGVIGIGGASGTTMITTIMHSLPFGLPKLAVSSTAAMPEYAGRYFGTKDLVLFHSVVDISGTNTLVRDILSRAAGCMAGMVNASSLSADLLKTANTSSRVAMSEFKFSDYCCNYIRHALEKKGFEVIAYHAQGIGDRAMDEAIEQGLYIGVLDIVPAGLSEELLGGNRAAGKKRLEAAGKNGIPQVVTPCGFDMISCGPLERKEKGDLLWINRRLAERKLFIPDAYRVQARTDRDELKEIARMFAEKLQYANGPVEIVIPLRGWSSLSEKDSPLYDLEADTCFLEELQRHINYNHINLTTVDAPLNNPVFAQKIVEKFLQHLQPQKTASNL
ncbi:MAG: Tm-1-like ATP-binding domain-containing protein [Bacillota bacterium]|nr:Tm-1-like ATP-binding domain-containing protein [Bacillota bacterium]